MTINYQFGDVDAHGAMIRASTSTASGCFRRYWISATLRLSYVAGRTSPPIPMTG
ncbi:putative esat-6 like protein [Mycobacterium tuberculosis]|nr:putative esat-6 like protein [Mycobacterium tuberculosis]